MIWPPAALNDSIRAHTRDVTSRYVQIGNEITSGMLWGTGRVGGSFDTPVRWAILAAVLEIVRTVPGDRGRGVFWWAPEWIATAGLGSAWENLTLFDENGDALPALGSPWTWRPGKAPAATYLFRVTSPEGQWATSATLVR